MTPYEPNIPKDLPSPSVAVEFIKNNFTQYADVFDNNHGAINSSNEGKHTHVIFQEQSVDPEVDGSFDSLYSKSVTSNLGVSQNLFARIPQFLPNGPNNFPIQLTFNGVNTVGPQYQSFLAGGYLIFFGSIPSSTSINSTITLVPAPTEILSVIASPTRLVAANGGLGPSAPLRLNATVNPNNFQFTIKSSPIGAPQITGAVNWLAICKQ